MPPPALLAGHPCLQLPCTPSAAVPSSASLNGCPITSRLAGWPPLAAVQLDGLDRPTGDPGQPCLPCQLIASTLCCPVGRFAPPLTITAVSAVPTLAILLVDCSVLVH